MRRTDDEEDCDLDLVISIHAPAKGATWLHFLFCHKLVISIHAPAKGATRGRIEKFMSTKRFQSTHPRRVRLVGFPHYTTLILNFNPRTREGCDKLPRIKSSIRRTFQSTHPRRVRPHHQKLGERTHFISIHAPAKGATVYLVTT